MDVSDVFGSVAGRDGSAADFEGGSDAVEALTAGQRLRAAAELLRAGVTVDEAWTSGLIDRSTRDLLCEWLADAQSLPKHKLRGRKWMLHVGDVPVGTEVVRDVWSLSYQGVLSARNSRTAVADPLCVVGSVTLLYVTHGLRGRAPERWLAPG